MEYLVALALVTKNKEEITLAELNEYHTKLTNEINKHSINALFCFSSKYAIDMVTRCSDFFEWKDEYTIHKKESITKDDLISKFLDYLSADLLSVIQNMK